MVAGAFNDVEFRSYLRRFDFSGVDTSRAGKNPRLLELVKADRAAFESFEKEFTDFLLRASKQIGLQLTCVDEVPDLEFPVLLETKCFYRGEDRRLLAITPSLAGFARAKVTQ